MKHVADIRLASLVEVEPQKERLLRIPSNLYGRAANNVLLTGARRRKEELAREGVPERILARACG